MGELPSISPRAEGNSQSGGELIGDAEINALHDPDQIHVAGVKPLPFLQEVVARVEVLQYNRVVAFAFRWGPRLGMSQRRHRSKEHEPAEETESEYAHRHPSGDLAALAC